MKGTAHCPPREMRRTHKYEWLVQWSESFLTTQQFLNFISLAMQSRSGKQTSLVPISLSPLSASQGAWPGTVAPTLVDCGFQSHYMTSIECLHKYALQFGRYPKLGLFTSDTEEIAGPFSSESNPPSPSMPPFPTDISFINGEDTLEDTEYPSAHRTTRPRSSRVSTELQSRRRKRGDSPDVDDENTKRHKSDTGDPGASTPRPPTSTTDDTETNPKTGKQFIVVQDKRGKVLGYRCPDHPEINCSRLGDMQRHLQKRDHQQPSYCCVESCGKKFTRLDALKRHISNLHPKGSLVVVVNGTGAETKAVLDV